MTLSTRSGITPLSYGVLLAFLLVAACGGNDAARDSTADADVAQAVISEPDAELTELADATLDASVGDADLTANDASAPDAPQDDGSVANGPVTLRWDAPAAGAVLTGKQQFRLIGANFLNVEIKQGARMIARCAISADHTVATVEIDTAQFANGSVTVSAHAWDSEHDTPFTSEADAGALTFTVNNPRSAATYADFIGACSYGTDDFVKLQSIGIRHARMDHPSAALIEMARQFGVEVLPIANYASSKVSGQNDEKYPPLPQNRALWAKEMVDKWRTMQNPPRVIEIWNEPFLSAFWKPAPDAPAYLALVKAFAAEAWSVWPSVTLLVSADQGLNPMGYRFRTELLKADTEGFLNDPRILPTTHNYVEARTPTQNEPNGCWWDLDRFECAYQDFKAHGHPNPQVWVTEFGWESDTPGSTHTVQTVSEAVHAQYTQQALEIFRASGKVAKAFAFLVNFDDKWGYNWLRPDNSEKPVCQTVRALIASGK